MAHTPEVDSDIHLHHKAAMLTLAAVNATTLVEQGMTETTWYH